MPYCSEKRNSRFFKSTADFAQEKAMENLTDLGLFLGGLGIFFVGIGALYGVSVWDKKD